MVKDPRAETRADQLRPLNRPREVTVLVDTEALPAVMIESERETRVERVQDRWRIDDEWWREPIARIYYRVLLETGAIRTIYHDRPADTWFTQPY